MSHWSPGINLFLPRQKHKKPVPKSQNIAKGTWPKREKPVRPRAVGIGTETAPRLSIRCAPKAARERRPRQKFRYLLPHQSRPCSTARKRANAGAGEARTAPEPAIICQIDKHVGARAGVSAIGKNSFIANQRMQAPTVGQVIEEASTPRRITAAQLRQLAQAQRLKQVLEGQIFAKWHKMRLVAPRKQITAARPRHNTVEIVRVFAMDLPPNGARYQNRLRRHAGAQALGKRRAFIQIKRQRRFRPDNQACLGVCCNSTRGLREHGIDDIGAVRRIPFFFLVDIWLDQQNRFTGR